MEIFNSRFLLPISYWSSDDNIMILAMSLADLLSDSDQRIFKLNSATFRGLWRASSDAIGILFGIL